MAEILIIDDDAHLCQMLTRKLHKMGHSPLTAGTAAEGMAAAEAGEAAVIFLDVMLPDGNGLTLLPRLKGLPHKPEVIIFTARGTVDGAEMAIRTGAWDYITKPTSLSGMILPLTRALEFREKRISCRRSRALKRKGIIGQSPQLEQCLDQVSDAADCEANVLIQGETGTGKELIAWAVHHNSGRSQAPFVTVDCASLPDTLAVGELFGHVRGSFTGADRNRTGLLAQAHGGTVFLDEVGELPLEVQKVFLRALQEKQFMPIGGHTMVKSDFRVLAATNRDLAEMAASGGFREDLLFRLRALNILLPPLCRRSGDISELASHYLNEICKKAGMDGKGMSKQFLQAMCDYNWPGNVRELVHTMERSIAAAGDGPVLYPQHLPVYLRVELAKSTITAFEPESGVSAPAAAPSPEKSRPLLSLQTVREETDRRYLTELLSHTKGDIKETCRISGLSRSRLYALLKKHGISTRN